MRTRDYVGEGLENIAPHVEDDLRIGALPALNRNAFIDRTGQRYGRLVILSYHGIVQSSTGTNRRRVWLCLCDCGNTRLVRYQDLKSGHTQSCGCLNREDTHKSIGHNRKDKGLSAFNQLYYAYKRSAARRGIRFDFTPGAFRLITQRPCFYCGLSPSQVACAVKGTYGDYMYTGIDRIDNAQGYTLDNVRPCCKQCNYAKRDLSEQEFYAWIKRIAAHSKEI